MKDSEIRALILKHYYAKRYDGYVQWSDDDIQKLGNDLNAKIVFAICDQLSDHSLIDWKPIRTLGGTSNGMGKITAFGVDVIEGHTTSDIKLEFVQNKTINVTGSSNVVVGDNNTQNITQYISGIEHAINSSSASDEEKGQAKGLLQKLAEHPLVAVIADGAIGLLK